MRTNGRERHARKPLPVLGTCPALLHPAEPGEGEASEALKDTICRDGCIERLVEVVALQRSWEKSVPKLMSFCLSDFLRAPC